jgi:hypothetical protein
MLCEALKKHGESKTAVFCTLNGLPASSHALQAKVRNIVKAAGITGEKLGAHTFRHTVGSLVAQSTGSALSVKSILGHSDINTSMDYIHDAEDSLAQRISPIQLMNDKLGIKADPEMNQLALNSPGDIRTTIEPISDDSGNIVDLLSLEYKEVPPGTTIHCRFGYDSICLLRRAFMGYTSTRISESDAIQLKDLYKRMVRLVK